MVTTAILPAQTTDLGKLKTYEHQLDDVMELIDISELKIKLKEVEQKHEENPTEFNKLRLGIIYHETALNLSFLSNSEFQGYAVKSFELLDTLFKSSTTDLEMRPFVASYRASALSLVAAETKKLKLLGKAFELFGDAVQAYSSVSYLPEFLRGSVAENLPWFFFGKRKFAKKDFESIISKQNKNSEFANWKIMSFTYWAWANQRQSKKYRSQSLEYLDKAIALDPNYKAGRKRAEELKNKIAK